MNFNAFFIWFFFLFYTQTFDKKILCKPFLTGLFETGPTTPESHISDYHNQPKADSSLRLQQQITAIDNNNKISENERQRGTAAATTSPGNTIYPEIIGNIFNSVRERVTNVVGNLLSSRMVAVGRQEQQQRQSYPTHQQQMDQKQEIKQSNKKVSPLSIMDAGMNYEHENKLNFEKVEKLESEQQSNGSGGTVVAEAIKVEQIKDGEVDKRLIGHGKVETNSNNEKISFDGNNNNNGKNEILLKNVENLMGNVTTSDMPLGRRLNNNGTNKIIDAFFDLDSDDIFYEVERKSSNQKIVQRPRLFPLILSSLVKYRNQSDMGFLQNTTRKERNRIRALYMLRPIIGVLRRRAENSRVRQNLRELERIMANMVVLTTNMMIARNENNGTNLSMAQQQLTQQQELMRMRAKLAFSNGFDKHFKRRTQTKTNQQLTTATNTHIQRLQQQEDSKFDENNTIIEQEQHNFDSNNNSFEQENDDDDENNSSSDESDESKSNLAFGETFGILILELIGTVAGLTWGAFSQLSQYVQGMGN